MRRALAIGLGLMMLAAAGVGMSLLEARAARAAEPPVEPRGPAPRRIVSLLPSLTETVCALGACNRLVGVDRHSNWPDAVLALPRLGGLDDTPIEGIVALRPDLVLAPVSSRVGSRLQSLGLRVLALEPAGMADTQRVILRVAEELGDVRAGHALWAGIEARMAGAAARVPSALRGRTVYFEVGSEPYAAGEASFVGELLSRLGLHNIVPASMGPFPQLNPEFVVRAQPALVVASAGALREMPRRPGWSAIAALRTQQACGFPPAEWDALVRPGPRLADGAALLADCLAALPPPAP